MTEKTISQIPKYETSLPGTMWGLTAYFNPFRYTSRKKNYDIFRESSRRQGLKLLAVELAFNNEDFELSDNDADIIVRRRSKSVLWQKERLLNIGLQYLPSDCDKIVWLDSDVVFVNAEWVKETAKLLESYVIVQPFSNLIRLGKDQAPDKYGKEMVEKNHSLNSTAFQMARAMEEGFHYGHFDFGYPGYVNSGRKHVFDKFGFFDPLVIGLGDSAMMHAFYGIKKISERETKEFSLCYSPGLKKTYENWFDKVFACVQNSVYYTSGYILHLWHGADSNRQYSIKREALEKYRFDPLVDIRIGPNQCWEWTHKNYGMERYARLLFYLRNEDDSKFISVGYALLKRLQKAVKKIAQALHLIK